MSLLFHFTCSFIKSPIFLYLFFNYLQKSRNILRNILLVPCFHFFLICWLASNLYCGRSLPLFLPHKIYLSFYVVLRNGRRGEGEPRIPFSGKNLYSSDTMSPEYKFLYFCAWSHKKRYNK